MQQNRQAKEKKKKDKNKRKRKRAQKAEAEAAKAAVVAGGGPDSLAVVPAVPSAASLAGETPEECTCELCGRTDKDWLRSFVFPGVETKWNKYLIYTNRQNERVRVATMRQCLACVMAISIAWPNLTWIEAVQLAQTVLGWKKDFEKSRQIVASREHVKQWKEHEVELVTVRGRKVSSDEWLYPKAAFQAKFGEAAWESEIIQSLLVNLHDPSGRQLTGILLKAAAPKDAPEGAEDVHKVTTFYSEYLLEKD
eukprot:s2816_g6.t1